MFWKNKEKDLENETTFVNENLKKEVVSFFKDLSIIIIIVLIVRTFIVLPFQISWQSMYDSYYDKEFIIVNRFWYFNVPLVWSFVKPSRWDVVVFNTHMENKEYFIKRIIWLPGETLKIKDGSVFVKEVWAQDFVELDEKYLMDTNYKSTYVRWSWEEKVYEIPEKSYFVMWDNRNASTDSRACFSSCEFSSNSNFVVKKDLVWKVLMDLWYFNLWKFSFTHPNLWIDTKPRFFSSPSNYEYK